MDQLFTNFPIEHATSTRGLTSLDPSDAKNLTLLSVEADVSDFRMHLRIEVN